MKLAADFRTQARQALRGKWLMAVLAGLLAALLGGTTLKGPEIKFNFNPGAGSRLFGYFPWWKTAVVANLLQWVLILLWTLLFIIPGIVASYSYAMTGYILAEDPDLTASQAIQRSKELMRGNRWRLFCLQLSFIGWIILCLLTFGIGNLFLNPYQTAADAAFYREISGTGGMERQV